MTEQGGADPGLRGLIEEVWLFQWAMYKPQRDEFRELMKKLTLAVGQASAIPPTHRCSGCGLRWEGELKGAELCGDCWRKGQAVIQAEASGVPASPQWLPIASAPKDKPVVIWNGRPYLGYYQDADLWFTDVDGELLRVEPPPTHWMPLPDPPGATDTPSETK